MRVEVVRDFEKLLALRSEWDALFAEAGYSHPFLTHGWVCAWWENFAKSSFWQRHKLNVLVVFENERLVGVAPLFKTSFLPSLGFFGLRYLRPLGADLNLTEIKPLISLPGYDEKLAQELDLYLTQNCHAWDFCQWPDTPAEFAASREQGAFATAPIENFIVRLPATFEEFRATRKRNAKEAIRKAYNKAEKEGIALDFVAVRDREEIIRHLPRFYELHGMRAAAEGTLHPHYFKVPAHRRFLEGLLRQEGLARPCLFIIEHSGKAIAMRVGFEVNQALYLYFSGFDPAYSPYSVVTRLVVEAMQEACARGVNQVNFSTGRDLSKTRWSPDELRYYRPFVVSSSGKARYAAAIFKWLRDLRRRSQREALLARVSPEETHGEGAAVGNSQ